MISSNSTPLSTNLTGVQFSEGGLTEFYHYFQSCSYERILEITDYLIEISQQISWMNEMMHFIASQNDSDDKKGLWDDGYTSSTTSVTQFSPKYWFGSYSEERLGVVLEVLYELESLVDYGQYVFHCDNCGILECAGCCSSNIAYHGIETHICLCDDEFWDSTGPTNITGDQYRALTILHEFCHWIWVPQGGIWQAVMDTHFCKWHTKAWYDLPDIRNLAKDCPNKAVRNPDNYAYFGLGLAKSIRNGLVWPTEWDLSPQPGGGVGGSPLNCWGFGGNECYTFGEPQDDIDPMQPE